MTSELYESPTSYYTTNGCCIPLTSELHTAASQSYIESGIETSVISVSNPESTLNYFSWYKDGISIPNKAGVGLTSIAVTETGEYKVLQVKDESAIDQLGCANSSQLKINERLLFTELTDVKNSYCLHDQLSVAASGDYYNLKWSPSDVFYREIKDELHLELNTVGSLKLLAEASVINNNLVLNGDFENGNVDFRSDLNYTTTNTRGAEYKIDNYVNSDNSYWATEYPQHANTQCSGDGDFLYADGFFSMPTENNIIWQQDLQIVKNKEYTFTFDHANISWNGTADNDNRVADIDAIFEVYVENQLIGQFTTQGNGEYEGVCRWATDTATWTSQISGNLSLEIRQKEFSGVGNDFALDNIRFGEYGTQSAEITVEAYDCREFSTTVSECKNDSVTISCSAYLDNIGEGESVSITSLKDDKGNDFSSNIFKVKNTSLTEYEATAEFYELGYEHLLDGDYEGIQNEFEVLDLDYTSNYISFGQFGKVTNAQNPACGSWCADKGDHTTGTGQMLFVDPGSNDADVFQYNLDLVEGKTYRISVYAANAANFQQTPSLSKQSQIAIKINGNVIGEFLELPLNNDWMQLTHEFTAPSTGNFSIAIRAKGDANLVGNGGNDFLLDDFSVKEVFKSTIIDYTEVDACLITEIDHSIAQLNTIYPNPASDVINISNIAVLQYSLSNVYGQVLRSGAKASIIKVSDLPSGNYILNIITTDNQNLQFPVVIE